MATFPRGTTTLGATDKNNDTLQVTDHPAHHNALADEIDAITAELRGGSAINLKHYSGGAGGGVDSDDAAWDWALTQLPGAGGAIYLPRGQYKITNHRVVTASNVKIFGDGIGATEILHSGVNTDFISLNGDRLSLSDLTVNGQQASNTGMNGAEVGVYGDDCKLFRVEIKNFNSIAIACPATRPRIIACDIVGMDSATVGSGFGIWYDSDDAIGVLIDACTIRDIRLNAIFAGGRGSRIVNSYFTNNHRLGSGSGAQIASAFATCRELVIDGCRIENGGNAGASGIEIDGYGHTVMATTVRNHAQLGIILQSGENHSVIGCQVSNNGTDGIRIGGGVLNCTIGLCRAYDDRGTKVQPYGASVESGANYYIIVNNNFRGNLTGGLNDAGGAVTKTVSGNLS